MAAIMICVCACVCVCVCVCGQAVKGAVGLPVAVECVALPWQEELCLRFMKEVEQLVKESRK